MTHYRPPSYFRIGPAFHYFFGRRSIKGRRNPRLPIAFCFHPISTSTPLALLFCHENSAAAMKIATVERALGLRV
jgi:hypothetical protein